MFEQLELNKRERMHKEMREKGTQNITTWVRFQGRLRDFFFLMSEKEEKEEIEIFLFSFGKMTKTLYKIFFYCGLLEMEEKRVVELMVDREDRSWYGYRFFYFFIFKYFLLDFFC